jgi:hypothetical protein
VNEQILHPSPPLNLVDNDISAVWRCIRNGKLHKEAGKLNTKLNYWTLEDTVWLGKVKVLYNRDCYDDIIQQMSGKNLVLVRGTPGIGKSLFLQRFLVYISDLSIVPFPVIHYLRYENGKSTSTSYVLLENGDVVSLDNDNAPDYLLSDSVDLNVANGKILSLEVASDKDANYNNFEKRLKETKSKDKATITMSLFSLEEMYCLNLTIEEDVLKMLFEITGGSARNLNWIIQDETEIKKIVETDELNLKKVREVVDWYFLDFKKKNFKKYRNVIINCLCKELSKTAPDEILNVVNSFFRHRDTNYNKIWSSKFIEILASEVAIDESSILKKKLKKLFGASGVGNSFKCLGHRKLTSFDKKFTLTPLNKKKTEKPDHKEIMVKFKLPLFRLKSVDDVYNLPDGHYGLPIANNFPLVDAVIQPDTFIQFTVSPVRHNGATKTLSVLRALLRDKNKHNHRMIFVVPPESLSTFSHQTNLSDIKQYVTTTEPVSILGQKRTIH